MPNPTLCTLCSHPEHQGRCLFAARWVGDTGTSQQCKCPGPSDSAACPTCKGEGSVWRDVPGRGGRIEACPDCKGKESSESAERPDELRWSIGGVKGDLLCKDLMPWATFPNPQELRLVVDALNGSKGPDDPPCPVTPQELLTLATYFDERGLGVARDTLRTLADYLERKQG